MSTTTTANKETFRIETQDCLSGSYNLRHRSPNKLMRVYHVISNDDNVAILRTLSEREAKKAAGIA